MIAGFIPSIVTVLTLIFVGGGAYRSISEKIDDALLRLGTQEKLAQQHHDDISVLRQQMVAVTALQRQIEQLETGRRENRDMLLRIEGDIKEIRAILSHGNTRKTDAGSWQFGRRSRWLLWGFDERAFMFAGLG
jgi:hypothetical protein